jgi:uncharacterized membrane protein YbaN (DUF454 family)
MEERPAKPKIVKNKTLRFVLIGCGFFFTFLAFLGAILPLVPTTPFLLVAAACFYRSSERFYNFIMNNKYFGQYLRDYNSGVGIPLYVKVMTLSFLWISTMVSILFIIPYAWLKILVFVINIIVTIHIYRIRTKKE